MMARTWRSWPLAAGLSALLATAAVPAGSQETIVLGSDGSTYDPATDLAAPFGRFAAPDGASVPLHVRPSPQSTLNVSRLTSYPDPFPRAPGVLPPLPLPSDAEVALRAMQDELIYRRAIDRIDDEDADVRLFLGFGDGATPAGLSLAERELMRAQSTYLFGLLQDLDNERLGIFLKP